MDEFLGELAKIISRIEKIEARQRANNVHDPECPRAITDKMNARGQLYYTPGVCDCWLKVPFTKVETIADLQTGDHRYD